MSFPSDRGTLRRASLGLKRYDSIRSGSRMASNLISGLLPMGEKKVACTPGCPRILLGGRKSGEKW